MAISPWDYYLSLRHKSWNELSEYEKEKMVLAAYLILDDCGIFSAFSELEAFLKIHLPEMSSYPYHFEEGVLGGFREWQESQKRT